MAARPARASAALALLCLPLAAQDDPPKLTAELVPSQRGLQFRNGDYTWKLGGYFKLDLIHDFDEIGSTDSFDVRTIPTAGSHEPDNSTRLHARQTRFNFDVQGPTTAGDFRAFFEGDFFSDQNGFRIRHAYGQVGSVLGGQTWSTFMDEDALPETLDFESPVATPMIRQAQVRVTKKLDGQSLIAFAIEDPDSDVIAPQTVPPSIPPASVPGKAEEPLPDFNARLRLANERGHVQLGLFAGMARFVPDVGSPDDVFLWGANLSTKVNTFGKDNAIVQVTYGEGVGRYRGGTTAAPNSHGNLEAVPVLGVLASYQHHWSSEYRSSFGYSWAEGDIPSGAPAATTSEELTYAFANLIWQFCDRAWAGVEYLYGNRETFDGNDGDANRLQMSLRFDI